MRGVRRSLRHPSARSAVALALSLAAPALGHAQALDADGDGAPDSTDQFPCDADRASVSWYPGETSSALLSYEDQWPGPTDLDFNDVVVRVNYRLELHRDGRVKSLLAVFDPVALGGEFSNGLGLKLPALKLRAGGVNNVTARRRVGEVGSWTALTPESDEHVTLVLSDNLRELYGNVPGRINVSDALTGTGSRLELEVTFEVPVSFSAGLPLDVADDAPFDVFIFRSGTSGPGQRHEIHFPKYAGTSSMMSSLFNTQQDGSEPSLGRRFVHQSGTPAALNLQTTTAYPTEGTGIAQVFPRIADFAASKGTLHRSFYDATVPANAVSSDPVRRRTVAPRTLPTRTVVCGSNPPARPPVGLVSGFTDRRETFDVFSDLPERTFNPIKTSAATVWKVTYFDTVGYHMDGHGWGCRWRLVVDGQLTPFFGSHTQMSAGFRVMARSMTWYLHNLTAGPHVVKVQADRPDPATATVCLAGWPSGETANFLAVEEIPANRIAMVQHMSDQALTPSTWTDLPGREVTYVKASSSSRLEVRLMDVLGYNMAGGHSWGCRWRLTMDGAVVGRPMSSHTSPTLGWRMYPMELGWVLDGVPAGSHTFRIQLVRPDSGSVSECRAGWPNVVSNSFVVHEVEAAGSAIARDFVDARLAPDAWTTISGRSVTLTKLSASSPVRVTYQDNLGYLATYTGWGCRWRLLVDGSMPMLTVSSHNSSATGWTVDPARLQWFVPGLSAGTHTFAVQVLRPSSATTSECLAGWPGGDTNNYLLAEELP
jgi:LruC domain-containing protein